LSQFDSKKNDVTEQLLDRMAMIELAVNGRLVDLPANTLLGTTATGGTVEAIPASSFTTPAQLAESIDQVIVDLAGGAPGALNTLKELAAALNNDSNFASTIIDALSTKASLANPVFTGIINNSEGRIQFPPIQIPSTDPNCFDDYEEGTFTPVLIGLTTSGTGTYTSQSGNYTKIGRIIFFNIFIEWSSHTGSGEMRISGLPFLSANSPISSCTVWHRNCTLLANNILQGYVGGFSGGIGQVIFSQIPVGGGSLSIVTLDIAAGLMINGSIFSCVQ
jgi:hypothetical protein